MLVFEDREKLEYSQKNFLMQSRKPTNSIHMTPRLAIKPGPHWWEGSGLTTAPFLSLPFKLLSLRVSNENWNTLYMYTVWEIFKFLNIFHFSAEKT